MKITSSRLLAVSALTVFAAPSFAAVDPSITEGMASVQTQIQELGAAGMPVLIALGILGIGIGIVMGLLRKGGRPI